MIPRNENTRIAGRWSRRLAVFALAPIAFALLAACGGGGGSKTDKVSAADRTATAEAEAKTRDSDGDGIPDDQDECPDQAPLEKSNLAKSRPGCPVIADDLAQGARADIDAFWKKTFDASKLNYRGPINFVSYGDATIRTACGDSLKNNAFYCPPSHSIYYHLPFFQKELDSNGEFAVAFIIAHEWGHLVQGNLGILGSNSRFLTIETELQADCYAGSWSADAQKRKLLGSKDVEIAIVELFRAGDPLDTPFMDPRAHGTAGQRIDAFQRGFRDGATSCRLFTEGESRGTATPARGTPSPTPRPGTPTPTAPSGTPGRTSTVPRGSSVISNVTMATDTSGPNLDPVNPTTVFTTSATFHAVVALNNAPANTRVRADWYATDVGGAAPNNTFIDTTELTASGSRNVDFTLKPASKWPVGKFRVEIFVNDALDRTVDFTVR